VSITVQSSEVCRHLVLRCSSGEPLPEAIVQALREHRVRSGWLRASGVLTDVELRAYDAELGALGSARRIAGPVHVLALEGSIGQSEEEPSFSMRALLAHESEVGLVTLASEIVSARAVALEVLVTALDDVVLDRALDDAGVWLVSGGTEAEPLQSTIVTSPLAHAGASGGAPGRVPGAATAWSAALEASERVEHAPSRPRSDGSAAASHPSRPRGAGPAAAGSTTSLAALPPRPARPGPDLDAPFPEPGDVVDHFAFGVCDVLRSDGDRLHLRVRKDGRIREIALEMLRVAALPDAGDGKRRFKLERRL
jgi:predicted DNA-binding protein with PD1-like motif